MKAMVEQNKALEAIRQEQREAKKEIQDLKEKLEPVHQIFESVTGFNSIAVMILKGLVLLGAGIGVIYTLIKYLKG